MRTSQPVPLAGSTQVGPATEVWSSSQWRETATEWIDEHLERRGVERVEGVPEQPRVRPWATLLTAQTPSAGRIWFKAVIPEVTSEAQVLRVLHSVAPDALPTVWADDLEREWILMPEQGPILRDVETPETAARLMSAVMRRYARVQRSSAPVVRELLDAGVPNMTPREISKQWHGLHLTPDTTREVRQAALRLEDLGMPMTIQHGDLHSGNVFADGTTSGMHEARIFDWSDASVGHPLCSLLTPMTRVAEGLDDAAAAEARSRLFRAYVTGWSDVVPGSVMSKAMDDAMLVARAGQVLQWRRSLARANGAQRRQWGRYGQDLIEAINASVANGS